MEAKRNLNEYDIIGQAREALERPLTYYNEPEPDGLELSTLDMIREEPVRWLITGYLPKEQITLICGTGGTGKTSVWVSLLASLSSGENTLFDGYDGAGIDRDPVSCMFFSSEDTVENVIKKKLRECGADMKMIVTMSLSDPRFDKIQFGSKFLEDLLERYRPRICVFDPLQAFISSKIKMSDRNAMRQEMRHLIEWGKKYGTTFLIVMHTNKISNVWGRQRMADSADLWDIARCVWMVGDADPNGLKYLSHEKSNYGKTGRTMLFRNDHGVPTFQGWTDKKDRDYVLEAARMRSEAKDGASLNEVCNTILSELSEHPDGLPVKDMDELLTSLGMSAWIVKRAKSELKKSGLIKYKRDESGQWNGAWKITKCL